jgi:dihydrofolate reductase
MRQVPDRVTNELCSDTCRLDPIYSRGGLHLLQVSRSTSLQHDMSLNSEMSSSRLALTLIVATTSNLGIGIGGQLPWRLKSEMQYFARVTSRVAMPLQSSHTSSRPLQNAVIMGRKTWMSIPPKFRPLKNRLNVVLSRQAPPASSTSTLQDGALWVPSLENALELLQSLHAESITPEHLPSIARAYIIGGAEVYREAIESGAADSVLLTRVQGEWDCDAFFPINLDTDSSWERKTVAELREFTGEHDLADATVKEGDTEFEYRLYSRKP